MGSIVSAITGSGSRKAAKAQADAAREANEISQEATEKSIQLGYEALNRMDKRWQEALALSEPYRDAGDVALANYESLLYGSTLGETATYLAAKNRGDDMTRFGNPDTAFQFETTPGYQFRMDEGQKALENSAAARSGVLSGRTLKATQEYGQNVATTEFDNVLARLSGLVQQGAVATGQATVSTQAQGQNEANALNAIGSTVMQGGGTSAQLATQVGAAQASGYLGQQAAGTGILNTAANLGGLWLGGKNGWFGS